MFKITAQEKQLILKRRSKIIASDIINKMFNPEKIADLYETMGEDQQSKDLLDEIYGHFEGKFKMSSGEEEAFNRFSNLINNPSKDAANNRNIIFKAAHALKIKLPSSMF
jgi:hypothetical protein